MKVGARAVTIGASMGGLLAARALADHLTLAFQKVANMLAAPPSLLHPRIALRVLRGSLT